MRKILLFSLLFLIGCASIGEIGKKMWGSSIEALEEARKDGVSKTYALNYETCFNNMFEVIKSMGHVFIKDKRNHVIVAMNLQGGNDTTELGIFFTEKDVNQTEITLSSTSTSLLNYASQKIFQNMDRIVRTK